MTRSAQRQRTCRLLQEFKAETRLDGARYDFLLEALGLSRMTRDQLRGVEYLLEHAMHCLCEVKGNE